MPKTKTEIVEKFHGGEFVDTQELVEAIKNEPEEETKISGYVVYADFEYNGTEYKAGVGFTPPAAWKRDLAYDEFRTVAKKVSGVTFMTSDGRRVILPLKEA